MQVSTMHAPSLSSHRVVIILWSDTIDICMQASSQTICHSVGIFQEVKFSKFTFHKHFRNKYLEENYLDQNLDLGQGSGNVYSEIII